ncbi:voltage-dependent calcium channel subunit alpha-2/delta-1-like [Osmerus eperlanus]|uniref:voltage-dependent calcium channel subunit alpha-2/delta-1-like n=1 Tax=Osmerus eperlanus TaxID=29151 RepID=UPI002E118D20
MDTNSLSTAFIIALTTLSCVSTLEFPTERVVKNWVEQMQHELVTLTDSASGIHNLVQIFHNHRKHFTIESNDARHLVSSAAGNIEKLLANRSRALHSLANAAEHLQMEHQWQDNLVEEDLYYYNAKDDFYANETETRKNRVYPVFKEDPAFKRPVDYNHTAVHIPTDIYKGSTIVVNELNWTAGLEEVFKKNKEEDPSLLWQVFGSATGLARYFPASPWMDLRKTPNKIDLYDVRRRPWYIQGAASPKNMLILVDASGSVSGLTLKLIRTSVNEMLETLSDDDYVNVVYFNSIAVQAACFDNLVQANMRNKKILKEAVQNISAKGITNYKDGFELAFAQLSSMNTTKHCNKIIMLFTDGGEERAQEIFQKYNPDKKVRIFTFSVGQHNYDKVPIQWMACNNKGYYYEIPSIGAIRINTQEYLDVLGRPMVKADKKAKQVQWTNVYLDALELGLVITGTLPVFNKTNTKADKERGMQRPQNQLILGVMAIDVSLDDIKRLTPRFTFGPNGYYFAIDPNGYVLLHPNLQPKNPKFQEPVTLDFLDAELEDEIKVEIRKKMIDGNTGNHTIHTLVKSQDERYIDRGLRSYTFAPVIGTDYSIALVLPEYSLHYIRATIGDTITQAKFSESLQEDKFDDYGYTLIAPREYCKDLKPSKNNSQFLMEFNEYIDRKTPNNPQCNVELVNRLLLDAGITSDLIKRWREEEELPHGVLARFVATDGGITRVFPKSAGQYWSEDAETYESSFYKRSLDNNVYIFTPTPYPSNDNMSEDSVLVSKAVDLHIDGTTLKPAVIGVKLDINAWMANFINATLSMNCRDEYCGCLRNDAHLDCVILDDGGFLVMANRDEYIEQIGQFFGVIDPILMTDLVNMSLFTLNKTYDYQSVCDPERESKADAGLRSVYVPTIVDILNVGWWASAAAWSILQQMLLSITFPRFLEAADAEEDLSDILMKQSCITMQTQFFFDNRDERSFKGALDCDNCSRIYHAEKLWKTNLVFIVSDARHTCTSCDPKPLIQAEQPSKGPDPCKLAKNPRYRKGPNDCFENNTNEDDFDCGGASSLRPPLLLLVAFQLALYRLLIGSDHHAVSS